MPVHPGRFLDTRYLRPLKITQQELAKILGVSRRRINELVQGRRGLTPDTAVRLASYFGTNARFWMDMQTNWDLFHAMDAGNAIQPLQTSS
jgi:addiction module HigA family antidote